VGVCAFTAPGKSAIVHDQATARPKAADLLMIGTMLRLLLGPRNSFSEHAPTKRMSKAPAWKEHRHESPRSWGELPDLVDFPDLEPIGAQFLLRIICKNYTTIYGIIFSDYGIGAIAASLSDGFANDILGSYIRAFHVTGSLATVGIIIALTLMKKPKMA
jgi:hypothetical protein